MSKADEIFKTMCKDVLKNGTTTEGREVRPKWEDGTSAYTVKKFGVVNEYDLREEFPILTLRTIGLKKAIDEILWIFQKKSNNIKNLSSHIWDQWADEKGSIGKAYGYQIGRTYLHHITYGLSQKDILEMKKIYPSMRFKINPNDLNDEGKAKISIYLDQMDAVLYDLRNNPFSRRIMTNIYTLKDLHEMNLQPCCWSCTFNVTDEGGDKLVLNMVLNQRSNDILVANNWNVVQYSALLMMVAQSCNMIPGKLIHVIADAHIYDKHIPTIKNLIRRVSHTAPKVTLDPTITDFYQFTADSFTIENYEHGPSVNHIPVAI